MSKGMWRSERSQKNDWEAIEDDEIQPKLKKGQKAPKKSKRLDKDDIYDSYD